MHALGVVFGLGVFAAGFSGCSDSGAPPPPTTTTTAAAARRPAPGATTTTLAPGVPEAAAPQQVPPRHHARLRERGPREPRVTRQQMRAHLVETLPARRGNRPPLSDGEIEQLTNKAMQIRVLRSRIARLPPIGQQTPRADAMRARLDVLMDEFQTKAGVLITDVGPLIDVPTTPPSTTQPAR